MKTAIIVIAVLAFLPLVLSPPPDEEGERIDHFLNSEDSRISALDPDVKPGHAQEEEVSGPKNQEVDAVPAFEESPVDRHDVKPTVNLPTSSRKETPSKVDKNPLHGFSVDLKAFAWSLFSLFVAALLLILGYFIRRVVLAMIVKAFLKINAMPTLQVAPNADEISLD